MLIEQAEQLDLFEQFERDNEKERQYRDMTEMYQQWLKMPDKIFVKEGTPEREHLSAELWRGYCKLYQHAHHECANLPPDKYIWMNPCGHNYWVINIKGEVCGKKADICPYCGAELSKGKGDAVLYKAESKYWLFYLHFDVPKHEGREPTPEDRAAIKAIWG